MDASSSTMPTSVASTITANARLTSNIRMNDTCAGIIAANEIDITGASTAGIRRGAAMAGAAGLNRPAMGTTRRPEVPNSTADDFCQQLMT